MFTCSQEIDDVWVVSKFTKNLQFPSKVPVVIFGSVFWEESQESWPLSVMPHQKQLYPLIPITFKYTQLSLGLENVSEIKEVALSQGLGCPHLGQCFLWLGAVLWQGGCLAAPLTWPTSYQEPNQKCTQITKCPPWKPNHLCLRTTAEALRYPEKWSGWDGAVSILRPWLSRDKYAKE